MMTARLALLALVATALADEPSERYYSSLGCSPIVDAGEVRPTRYNCSFISEIPENKCFFQGRLYNDGEQVDTEVLASSPCIAGCYCRGGSLECANVECFGDWRRRDDGCYLQFELDKCCSVKEHCEARDGPVSTCKYNGQTYKEGEKFSAGECTNCVCKPGFDGTLSEPFCQKFQCDLWAHYSSRIRRGCVPAYYTTSDCCPIPVFTCPNQEDVVVGQAVAAAKSEDYMCKFGEAKLGVGQRLQASEPEECVECFCQTPPQITCVMNTTCYEGRRNL